MPATAYSPGQLPRQPAYKRLLGHPALRRLAPPQRLVLLYHDVRPAHALGFSPLVSHTPACFAEQLAWFGRHYRWVSLHQLLAAGPTKEPLAALTFDDGFRTVRTQAHPLLHRLGIPYTVFLNPLATSHNYLPVTTANLLQHPAYGAARQALQALYPGHRFGFFQNPHLGPTDHETELLLAARPTLQAAGLATPRLYLTPDDVDALLAQGVTFGAHGRTHRNLAACPPVTLAQEVGQTAAWLAQHGWPHHGWFALPFGKRAHYSPLVLNTLAQHGFTHAFTTNPVPVAPSHRSQPTPQGVYRIPRLAPPHVPASHLGWLVNRPLLGRVDL